jgi:glycerol transport system ATP-binding protein
MLTATVGEGAVKVRLHSGATAPQAGDTAWLQLLGAHTCFYKNEELIA